MIHTATVSLTVGSTSVPVNVALSTNGGVAVASSSYNIDSPPSSTIDGDRTGLLYDFGGAWNDGTWNLFPDWLEVDFNGTQTISEVDVFSPKDDFRAPVEPTPTMTFNLHGLQDFEVQYWTGSAWAPIPGATVTGNNLVWRKFTFSALATSKIRVVIAATADGLWSRITEVEAYNTGR